MKKFSLTALVLTLFAVPTVSAAGPIRDRLHDRVEQLRPHWFTPTPTECPGGVCPLPQAPPVVVPQPMPQKPAVVGAKAPAATVFGLGDHLKHRILINHARAKAVEGMVTKGMNRSDALAKVNKVDDDTILAAAQHYGALGDGAIVQTIEKFLSWLASPDGQAAIANLVKLIMTLASLFGDEKPASVDVLPIPTEGGSALAAAAWFDDDVGWFVA